jgi:two-component system response regulator
MVQQEIEILLIEDNPNEAELTIRSLKKNNLANHLLHVHDGAEALELIFPDGLPEDAALPFHPKVILLDLKLPRVDGLEVLRHLKGDRRTSMIPVVILTSSQEDRDVIESYRFGVNSYLVKPVNFGDFSKAVGELGLYWLLRNLPPPVGIKYPPL